MERCSGDGFYGFGLFVVVVRGEGGIKVGFGLWSRLVNFYRVCGREERFGGKVCGFFCVVGAGFIGFWRRF